MVIDNAVARPTGFQYAAAWMVPNRELISHFEQRVQNLGWWFDYFHQQNAWGAMDMSAAVRSMVGAPAGPGQNSFEGTAAGEERRGFCWCPPGDFKMGFGNAPVTLSQGFWMKKNPVSQREYFDVMGENPSGFVGQDLPVDSVNRDQVIGYCRKLTQSEREKGLLPDGWEYALPTEAQWEYAARAGTDTAFSWGDDISQADDYTWNITNAGYRTHPTGKKKPNHWNICDGMGNTLEWCRDAWVENYPSGVDPEVTEDDLPQRPGECDGAFWVSRGGGWFIPPDATPRVRIRLGAGDRGYLLGFRVAVVRSGRPQASSGLEKLRQWGEVMTGEWLGAVGDSSAFGSGAPGSGFRSSARWLADKAGLEGEFHMGTLSGHWFTTWNYDTRQIEHRAVNTDGSTGLTVISKHGDKWRWLQSLSYPDGSTETNIDTVTVAPDGNTLHHHVTNRVRGGQRLPDIKLALRRAG